jgi:hypothetical protein
LASDRAALLDQLEDLGHSRTAADDVLGTQGLLELLTQVAGLGL